MEELLTPGKLDRLMKTGERPDTLIVQVLGSKSIGERDKKIRLLLWDGTTEYKHAVLDVTQSALPPPEKFSIVKVSDSDLPSSLEKHYVTPIKSGAKALVLNHYTVVKEAAMVGQRLGSCGVQPSSGHSQTILSQPDTPPSHTTPHTNRTTPIAAASASPCPPALKAGSSHTPATIQSVKRDLDPDFTQPAKRGPGDQNPSHQVADLNPYINKYRVKVRVDAKSSARRIQTQRFDGNVQDCVVSDQSGSIKITAWGSANQGKDDTVYLDKLEVDNTYMLEGLQVKAIHGDPKWNKTGHNYELTWGQNTVATGPCTDNPIKQSYKFVPISSLGDTPANTVVDLLAWVKEVGDVIHFRSKAEKDLTKREVVLADNSAGGSSINLVLWAEAAEQFNSYDAIIAIKGAKVAEFNGIKNISLAFTGTMDVDPDVPEAAELEKWASGLRGLVGSGASQSSQGRVAGDWSTLQEIKEMLAENRSEKKFTVVASPIKVKNENMWYRAHQPKDGKTCRKKVTENNSNPELYDCRCGEKKLCKGETELRYMVSLCLADSTSWVWATMFDASALFHMTAQELHDLRLVSETKFDEKINKVQFTEAVFTVTAKVETFNQAPQLKFTVKDMEPIGWGQEGGGKHIKRRWLEIIELEEQLGVSHEEEYGIAVGGCAAYNY